MDNTLINALISKSWVDTTSLPIQPSTEKKLTDDEELFIASVVFSGKSQGSLTLATGKILATKIASRMFDCEQDMVSFDDIQDSIGELVNILAGNMKSDFFGNSDLSKPLVMQGSEAFLKMLGSDVIFEKMFSSDKGEQLIIQICHTN